MSILDAIGSLFIGMGESAVGNAAERLDALRKQRPTSQSSPTAPPAAKASKIDLYADQDQAINFLLLRMPTARSIRWIPSALDCGSEFRVLMDCMHVLVIRISDEEAALNAQRRRHRRRRVCRDRCVA